MDHDPNEGKAYIEQGAIACAIAREALELCQQQEADCSALWESGQCSDADLAHAWEMRLDAEKQLRRLEGGAA